MTGVDGVLQGRKAFITGGSRGIGLEIAKAFVQSGCSVSICARNTSEVEFAGQYLCSIAANDQKIHWITADVTDEKMINCAIRKAVEYLGGIEVLVNNAGVYGPFGFIEDVSWDEWWQALEINLKGSVLPVRAILPLMKQQNYGKIIQLSGGGATAPMPRISAYAASKAAVVRFVETISEECVDNKIDINAIAPGAINTRLLDEILDAGKDKVGEEFYRRAKMQKKEGGVSITAGTQLAVFLASKASDGVNGKLISAIWDNWIEWPAHLEQIKNSDVYTLRRIVGRDRGISWGDK